MKPLYIFDLDGTLANCEHRKHHLDAKDWRAFYAACDQDAPIIPVIHTLITLWRDNDVWIFSGRSDEVRGKTMHWLGEHVGIYLDEHSVVMRREGDHRPDDVLKQEFLDRMLDEDRNRLVACFDDRDRVVAMWRKNGIACFQVAPGEF